MSIYKLNRDNISYANTTSPREVTNKGKEHLQWQEVVEILKLAPCDDSSDDLILADWRNGKRLTLQQGGSMETILRTGEETETQKGQHAKSQDHNAGTLMSPG